MTQQLRYDQLVTYYIWLINNMLQFFDFTTVISNMSQNYKNIPRLVKVVHMNCCWLAGAYTGWPKKLHISISLMLN